MSGNCLMKKGVTGMLYIDLWKKQKGDCMTEQEQKAYIQQKMAEIRVNITEEQAAQFLLYYQMLVETNQVMNLTAITEFTEVVEKHFVDSVIAPKQMFHVEHFRLIDVGTGAGFPGIPLKIIYPHIQVTLLDSLNKRITFLKKVCEALHLEAVTLIHGRAEELAQNAAHREQYDLTVSRAVANLSTLSEYCLPFIKQDGYFVAYKSGAYEEELEHAKKGIQILGGKVEKVEKYVLPGTDMKRSEIIIRKVKTTPKKYPRKAGTPAKEPLK